METNKTFVKELVQKQDDGNLTDYVSFGTDFENIFDTRAGKANYSLAQFFDNYLAFLNNYKYVAYGPSQPSNKRAIIWIDTSTDNQAKLG